MEQPTNLMTINGVVVLDRQLDFDRFLQTVESRFLAFRRFRQKAVEDASGAYWVTDDAFDIRNHVRRITLPGAGGRAELENLVSELASTPLDKSYPLWQFHVVENYTAGPALIVRIHHCIADGIALVQVFLSLTDSEPDVANAAPKSRHEARHHTPEPGWPRPFREPIMAGTGVAAQVARVLTREGRKIIRNPATAAAHLFAGGEFMRELAQAFTMPDDPASRLRGRPGTRKQVAWAEPIPLPEIKAVSKAYGCTVNDVLIAAVTGALRHYLIAAGQREGTVEDVRAAVPVNLRPPGPARQLGNQFGLVFLPLPLQTRNPLERLYQVNERMMRLKGSRQAAVTFGLLMALGMAPAAVQKPVLDLLSAKATTVLTNVPGPQHAVYLAGARISQMMFWVPQNGNISLGISILSYDGKVFFGLFSDPKVLADPAAIISRFRPEFEKLLYLALMLPAEGRPSPRTARALAEVMQSRNSGRGD